MVLAGIPAHRHTQTHTHTHARTHARKHARTDARAHTHKHTHTRARAHTHTYTYTHTHSHSNRLKSVVRRSEICVAPKVLQVLNIIRCLWKVYIKQERRALFNWTYADHTSHRDLHWSRGVDQTGNGSFVQIDLRWSYVAPRPSLVQRCRSNRKRKLCSDRLTLIIRRSEICMGPRVSLAGSR